MPSSISENNRRLAKNTIYLYIRTMVVMFITLYTSRVVLHTLGAADFGIYNVVGGVVVMFSFISGALATATQRFLNFALGQGDTKEVQRVFSISLLIYFYIAVFIVLLAEVIGLPFLITQMNFPDDRWLAVHWVYQLSILSFCLNIIRTPYTASIIAYEQMNFYAYISIIENLLKLLIVFMLVLFSGDKLIVYAVLMTAVIALTNIIYYLWCKNHFSTCTFSYYFEKSLFRKLFSFSGWSMLGSLTSVGANQGVNIVFNIFTGVLVNAAMGIAGQVQSAVSSFVGSFQTAMSPQLVKLGAAGEIDEMNTMINRTSRLSYCLIFLFGVPAIVFCKLLLSLWLVEVPEYAVEFSQLMIAMSMIEALSAPLWFSVQATGKIKHYQMIMSLMFFLNIPFAILLLKLGLSPVIVILARVIIQFSIHIVRSLYLGKVMTFSVKYYFKKVMLRCLAITILTIPLCIYIINHQSTILFDVFLLLLLMLQNLALIFLLGLEVREREAILNYANRKLQLRD